MAYKMQTMQLKYFLMYTLTVKFMIYISKIRENKTQLESIYSERQRRIVYISRESVFSIEILLFMKYY